MNICVFGDSITRADYLKDNWVELLTLYLEKNNSEITTVHNLGINGDTSTDILLRLTKQLKAFSPIDIVIFAFGVNDSAYVGNEQNSVIDLKLFEQNINRTILLTKQYTNKIFFVGLTLGDENLLNPYNEGIFSVSYGRLKVKKYDEILGHTAKQNDCVFITIFDKLKIKDFIDGLHPNSIGHRKMFEEVKKYF